MSKIKIAFPPSQGSSRASSFHAARRKFGPCIIPPMSQEFKSYRTRLNKMSTFVSPHPLPYVVHSWTIPQDRRITKLESSREIIWVDNWSKLTKMCDNIIQNDSLIGLDSKFNQSLFYDIVAIVQI
jgi:hypothetical protein